MSFQILKATVNDALALNALVNSAYRGESSRQGWTTEADLLDGTRTTPELLTEILANPLTTILKYEEDGKVLGCVELRKDGSKLYLGMLTVSPKQQGKGIGSIMIREAENEARKIGSESVYMTVISTRTELIDWYKRCGYTDTGKRKPFILPDERWGIPKLKMEFAVLEKQIVK
jgi:ribosomal protein S18 acetylase RimI-like enzyme